MLTRETILGIRDITRELVAVPEWGGDVWVQVMSGTDRDAWEVESLAGREVRLVNMRAKLAVRCIVDVDGNRLFTNGDVEALGKKNWRALERIVTVAQRLNHLGDEEMEKLKGNSVPSLGDVPSSASP
jgi:hypothetical protein